MVAEQAEPKMNWDDVFAVAGVWEEGIATFNGQWEVAEASKQWRGGQTWTINGTSMTAADGKQLAVIVSNDKRGYICSHTSGSDLFQARLSADNRKLEWDDGSTWSRVGKPPSSQRKRGGEDASLAARLFGPDDGDYRQPERGREGEIRRTDVDAMLERPSLSLVQVLRLQDELCVAFMDADFQERLEELEATQGKASAGLTSEHKQLFLTVEDAILPRYGLDRGQKGVRQMLAEFDRFGDNEEVRSKREMINETLGLAAADAPEPPVDREEAQPAAEEDDEVVDLTPGREAPRGQPAPIEVVVRHLTEDVEVKVEVPGSATFRDVKEALSQLVGRPEILKGCLMTREEDGTYSAFEDYERVGATRQVLCKASLRARAKKPEEKRAAGAAPQRATGPVQEAREAVAACRRYLEERRQRGRAARAEEVRRVSELCQEEQRGRELAGRRRLPLEEQRRLELEERSAAEARRGATGGGAAAAGATGAAASGAPAAAAAAAPAARPAPPRRAWEAARCFLVLGGEDGDGQHDSTEVLHLAHMAFGPGPRMGAQRSGFAAADLGEGRLLVAGGSAGSKCLESTEVLDLREMAFSPGPPLSCRRAAGAAAGIGGQRLLVLGGRDRSTRLDTSEILDLASMSSSPGPRMLARRSMFALARLDEARLLVIGGHDGSGALDSTEILDLRSMSFARGPRMRSERFSCAACMIDEEHLLVAGGVGERNNRLETTEVLELETMKFTPGPSMGKPRSGCAAMALDEQRLIVVGGFDGACRQTSTEVLDLSEWAFTCGPSLHIARGGCAAISC